MTAKRSPSIPSQARGFVDEDVTIGTQYGYEILAIGEEGRGPAAPKVIVRALLLPIEHARLSGFYDVILIFRRIGLLSSFEGSAIRRSAIARSGLADLVRLRHLRRRLRRAHARRPPTAGRGSLPGHRSFGRVLRRRARQLHADGDARRDRARVVGGVLYALAFRGRSQVDSLPRRR